jgi:branched-chain amino acid transport system substrate-binding protein
MKTAFIGLGALALIALPALPASAVDSVKIGLILPYSGQFADTAVQIDDGVKLYMQQHGDTVAGKKIEIIRKDTGGINPGLTKRLAQELLVRDHAAILAGFAMTPNAFAGGDISKKSKTFMVDMNASTPSVVTKSPYLTRSSFTTAQIDYTLGKWSAEHGVKSIFTMVTDYGPGINAEIEFTKGFKAAGGKVVGSVRTPVANPDFASFLRRAKDSGADGIFIWTPGGAQPGAVGKALREQGISPKNTKIIGQDALTTEDALKSMGPQTALGIISVWNYNYNLDTPKNKDFVTAYNKAFHRNPDLFSAGGYDGMHVIYAALEKTGGKTAGPALIDAVKGLSWESPRGPVSIDPKTRDITENVYIMKVEEVDGELRDVTIDTIKNVPGQLGQ